MVEQAVNYTSNAGYLTINGVSMHCPAWTMNDIELLQLWTPAVAVRGQNATIPGAQGTISRRKRFDEARYSLPIVILGTFNRLGTPQSDPFAGLQANLGYLYANIVTAGTLASTYPATLDMPSGGTRSADVQVEGIHYTEHVKDLVIDATLELVIPSGGFV